MAQTRQQVWQHVSEGYDRDASGLHANMTSTIVETTIPEPNPPFVFPMRPASSSSPKTTTLNLGRRPITAAPAISPSNPVQSGSNKRRTASALPAFDFHPSIHHDPVTGLNSPPASPTANMPIPSRPVGHRRGGSEFIGGDGQKGGPGLMSTSPTKGDGVLPFPDTPSRLGPSTGPIAGRRGHAHRRSGAISCHDLSVILKPQLPTQIPRGGSAPTSPAETDVKLTTFSEMDQSPPREASSFHVPNTSTADPAPPTPRSPRFNPGPPRSRVGFSDTVEFIPRPLSSLSSETSSSITTVRGHSVSGSISSVISTAAASPPSAKQDRRMLDVPLEEAAAPVRPKTAGAVMNSQCAVKAFAPDLFASASKRPSSASASPTSSPSSERFVGANRILGARFFSDPDLKSKDKRSLKISQFDSVHADSPASSDSSLPRTVTPVPSDHGLQQSALVKSKSPDRPFKKQKKVKTWAGSILSRKPKHGSQKRKGQLRRSPTPPLRSMAPGKNIQPELPGSSDHSPDFTDVQDAAPPSPPQLDTSSPYQERKDTVHEPEMESLSPVIDLDAALGPFNTPSLGSSEYANFLRGGGLTPAKRRMHSSGITGGFGGPGMHYHRRTESAPEMAVVDQSQFSIHRYGSSSTMADVFEEDEEEDEEAECEHGNKKPDTKKARSEEEKEEVFGMGISVVDSADSRELGALAWTAYEPKEAQRGVKRKGSGLSEVERREFTPNLAYERSVGSLRDEAIQEEAESPVENAEEPPRPLSITKSSDSTITPPLPAKAAKEVQPPVNIGIATPYPPYLTPQTPSSVGSSSFPSPDFPPTFFDAPRVVTASSSFTDDQTLDSLLLGEPGPEVRNDMRMSVEDVPSLTSSNSTMTSAAANKYTDVFPASRAAAYTSHGERSFSISSCPSQNQSRRSLAGKRASLVSLSRLVSSSHGEKSKLSIEERAQPDTPEKSEKKKGKRLSRMMHFWKPKESTATR
ncbi:MAG: hypothetical protein M1824_006620 [Vezdaea acicularis]|nr:MAG: hypothetical protein M1824_006620 [Vezdaea acicularis]